MPCGVEVRGFSEGKRWKSEALVDSTQTVLPALSQKPKENLENFEESLSMCKDHWSKCLGDGEFPLPGAKGITELL